MRRCAVRALGGRELEHVVEGDDQQHDHVRRHTQRQRRPRDGAARDAYLPHPEHVALGQTLLRPIADDVLVMDYTI